MTNPNDIPNFLKKTTWEFVEDTEEFQAASHLINRIIELAPIFLEKPRLHSLYDQLTRNSQSILHNLCEAFGKGRGYYQSALLIARGEAFETCASISICPAEIRDELKPLAIKITQLLTSRILDCAQK
jgi:four helix bundle protein